MQSNYVPISQIKINVLKNTKRGLDDKLINQLGRN